VTLVPDAGAASLLYEQLLIANARRQRAQKRDGGKRVNMDENFQLPEQQCEELPAVDRPSTASLSRMSARPK